MIPKVRNWVAVSLGFCLAASYNSKDFKSSAKQEGRRDEAASVLWQQQNNISSLNLFYGPGGEAHQPKGPFRFIEEDLGGSKPKFKVEDGQRIRWKVKLGGEAQPETTATRFLWAAGYFADEDYYLPEL